MISQLPGQGTSDFGKALMLSIAYAATIGGMATLIGTPTNLVFAGIVRETYGTEITFLQWLSIGFPLMVILLFLSWLYLTRIGFKMAKGTRAAEDEDIRSMVRTMGKMTYAEKAVSVVFLVTALCWILRSFVLEKFIPEIDDSVIAIAGALLLFMIPSRAEEGGRIMDWKAASAIPWGIILLFGGGLSVAAAFQSSGLAGWMGNQLALLQGVPLFLLILFLVTGVTILSEIASNVATAAMILPVLVALAAAIGVHPFILMVAATLGASCGFMLPVATPPNAVVFGSGYLKIRDMMRAGLWMDILCVLIVSIFIYLFLEIFWKALLV
jgi:sodium-dependent dicarboxylate transporter 2/3/5